MKQKSTIIRYLLLFFISTGIFISSFHAHSDLDWDHAKTTCQTGTHLNEPADLCPVCGFRLKAASVVTPSFAVVETVTLIANAPFESKKLDAFAGQITGRSPPFLV